MIVNEQTQTGVDEVAAGIYRICTVLDVIPGGFTFNSYLVADDEPCCSTRVIGSYSRLPWKPYGR
jgi:hypothetical protein